MKTHIMFRIDDICPGINWMNFQKCVQILERYGAKPLLGVVPDCLDPKLMPQKIHPDPFWRDILHMQSNGYIIAQHGYRHVYCTAESGMLGHSAKSEFCGLPYPEQYEKLLRGKEILMQHGLHPSVFMAPSHSFDKDTLAALHDLGFTYISDGLTKKPYYSHGMCFIPCRHTVSLRKKLKGVCTICLHTNSMEEVDFIRLERFCVKYAKYVMNFAEALSMEYHKENLFQIRMAEVACSFEKRFDSLIGRVRRAVLRHKSTGGKNKVRT